MREVVKDKPMPDTEIQKCIDALSEANQKGEIQGMAVALVGTAEATTVQHIAGKFNIAVMLGCMEFLKEFLMKERADFSSENY